MLACSSQSNFDHDIVLPSMSVLRSVCDGYKGDCEDRSLSDSTDSVTLGTSRSGWSRLSVCSDSRSSSKTRERLTDDKMATTSKVNEKPVSTGAPPPGDGRRRNAFSGEVPVCTEVKVSYQHTPQTHTHTQFGVSKLSLFTV